MAEAAPVVPVAHYRVDQRTGGFSLPVIDLRDRRNAGHHPPLIRWIFQKHLEIILFNSYGESGAVWKLLHQASLGRTTLACDRAAVNGDVISDAELKAILDIFKRALPADMVDPCSRNKIRSCVLIPLAAAGAVCRLYGRSEASMSFLRAVNQPIPQLWQMEAEAEANEANLEADLVLLDKIDDHGYEAEEMSFAEELTMEAPFTPTVEDETKLKQYALSPVPAILKSELNSYIRQRCAVFASKRSGAAVVSATAEHDTQSLLKFYGWMARYNKIPEGQLLHLSLLGRREMGDLAQQFAEWLVSNQRVRYSTISNYLSGIIGCMNCARPRSRYDALTHRTHLWQLFHGRGGSHLSRADVYFTLEADADALAMAINPLEQVVNLRDQASKSVHEQTQYEPTRVGGWITWPEVQAARVKAVAAYSALVNPSYKQRLTALKEAVMISFMSLLPPDRVGVVRAPNRNAQSIPMGPREAPHALPCIAPRPSAGAPPSLQAHAGRAQRRWMASRPVVAQGWAQDLQVLRSLLHRAARGAQRLAEPPARRVGARGRRRRRGLPLWPKPLHRPAVRERRVDDGRQARLSEAPRPRGGAQDPSQLVHHMVEIRDDVPRGAQGACACEASRLVSAGWSWRHASRARFSHPIGMPSRRRRRTRRSIPSVASKASRTTRSATRGWSRRHSTVRSSVDLNARAASRP